MGSNRQLADQDAHAAYLNTIRWYVSGDTAYANTAMNILNAWAKTVNQVPSGTDIPGLIGIPIQDFALAGEVLRTYPGWSAADFAAYQEYVHQLSLSRGEHVSHHAQRHLHQPLLGELGCREYRSAHCHGRAG